MSGIPGPTLPSTGIGLVDAVFRRLVDWLMLVPMQGHLNSNLADIADLTPTDGNFIVGDGTNWVAESGSTARTSLGLGTAAVETYTEGTFTPALTFATAGDLSVTYSTQLGYYTRIGRLVVCDIAIVTSAFTHTTASGNAQITGLPLTSANDTGVVGSLRWAGITKASYSDAHFIVQQNSTVLLIGMSGSGQSAAAVQASDMPTGGSVLLRGQVTYRV